MNLVYLIPGIVAIPTLMYGAVLDYRTMRVPVKIYIPWIIISIIPVLYAAFTGKLLDFAFAGIVIAFGYFLAGLQVWGGGDVIAGSVALVSGVMVNKPLEFMAITMVIYIPVSLPLIILTKFPGYHYDRLPFVPFIAAGFTTMFILSVV